MKKMLFFSLVFVLAVVSGAWADLGSQGPLPGNKGFSISVANNSNTFYMAFPSATQGLNAEWVGPVGSTSRTGLTIINTANPFVTGSLAAYDTGGVGSAVTDFILLLSVQGPIASNFGVELAWGTNNETFNISDFIYGPQTTKPGPNATMSLYPGQDISNPTTAAYLMFIDLKSGSPGLANAVPVNYSFTGLYGDVVAINMYGYSPTGGNVNPGTPSINWTNNTGGTSPNGYIINGTAAPVPIPPAFLLFGTGLIGLVGIRRFK